MSTGISTLSSVGNGRMGFAGLSFVAFGIKTNLVLNLVPLLTGVTWGTVTFFFNYS